ncbi:MAG: hypothetical protein GY941_22750 [Planctomycetes bacterium]|nr:hypothetical protein [Planctomycetota bacterium]
MVLHCETAHEDTITAATIGQAHQGIGGAAYTAAMFKPTWDGLTKTGKHDTFRDIKVGEFDTRTDALVKNAFASIHFSKDDSDLTYISKAIDIGCIAHTEAQHVDIVAELKIDGDYNVPMRHGDTVIDPKSKWGGTEANSDLALILAFSHGGQARSPTPHSLYRPNTIVVGDVSDGASTADTLLTAYSQQLNKSNVNTLAYLDPDKYYNLYGIVYGVPVIAKIDMFATLTVEDGINKGACIAGFGNGSQGGSFVTSYTFDAIRVKGDAQLTAKCITGAASTPHICGLFAPA